MSFFRHSQDVRDAQTALNTYSDQQNRAGNHEITDEYLRLNDNVEAALRAEKAAKKKRG